MTNGHENHEQHEHEEPQLPSTDIMLKAIRAAKDDEEARRLLDHFTLAVREDAAADEVTGYHSLASAPGVQAALVWVRLGRDLVDTVRDPIIGRDEAISLVTDQIRHASGIRAAQATMQAANGILADYTAMLKPGVSEQEGLERIRDGALLALAEPGDHPVKLMRALVAARKMTIESEPMPDDKGTRGYL